MIFSMVSFHLKRIDVFIISFFSFIILSTSIILSSKTNISITYDGYQYLVSAKVLFSNSMGELYQWIREPGYPFFLSIFYNLNFNYSAIIVFQSLLIALSTIMAFSYFYLLSKNSLLKFLYFFSGLLSFVLVYGYSTWILQQFFFVFLTSLHLMLYFIIKFNKDRILLVTLLSSFLLLITSLWSIILVPGSISAILFCLLKNKVYSFRRFPYLFLVILFPAFLFLSSWNIYKSMEVNSSYRVSGDANYVTDYGKVSLPDLLYLAPSNFGGLLGYSFETSAGSTINPTNNQSIFSFKTEFGGITCGVLLDGPKEIIDQLPNLPNADCEKTFLSIIYSKLTNFLQIVLPILLFFSFLGFLFYVSKGRETVVSAMIFPMVCVLPYLLEEYGKSRYGLPFIFLSPFIFTTIIVDAFNFVFSFIKKSFVI
jgi:hypothetical protein